MDVHRNELLFHGPQATAAILHLFSATRFVCASARTFWRRFDVLPHLFAGCRYLLARALHPIRYPLRACRTGYMRERALAWVCKVHPLCKKPAMERDAVIVVVCNLTKLAKKAGRESAIRN